MFLCQLSVSYTCFVCLAVLRVFIFPTTCASGYDASMDENIRKVFCFTQNSNTFQDSGNRVQFCL